MHLIIRSKNGFNESGLKYCSCVIKTVFSVSKRKFIVIKCYLLSLLDPKKVTKKRHPLPGPVKRDSLVLGFFVVGVTNSSRFVGTQTCAAFSPKKT